MSGQADRSDVAPMVYVVVLNWNGWRDTIACLESVLRLDYPAFQVVVCDNASTDSSLERLVAWARGDEPAPAPDAVDTLAPLFSPPLAKPVPHTVLARAEAEAGGTPECEVARVVFVQTGANLGFAGGCNVGLRFALARRDAAFAWVLNNDTVVARDALSALVRRMTNDPAVGLCGSRILFYDDPGCVQCLGGATYGRWLGTTRRLGQGDPVNIPVDPEAVERAMHCVYGASVLVSARYLRDVGLMEESYFMYFEELDWAARGAGRFTLTYAHDSIVYHREGRSGGAHVDARRRSAFADLQLLRGRLRFTRRFHPRALLTVYLGIFGVALRRAWIGEFQRARMIVQLAFGGRPAGAGDLTRREAPLAVTARRRKPTST